jgi:hypothetical protein
MDEARFGHFGERDADEGAREKCGMGDGQARFVAHLCAVEQDVDVDDPRNLALVRRTNPAALALEVEAQGKQRSGGELGFQSNRGVEVAGLGRATLGLGFVERARRCHAPLGGQGLHGQPDLGRTVPEIRPQA